MQEIKQYENAVENIAKKVCKILKYNYDKSYWTGGEIGDTFDIHNMFISLDEMVILLKMNITKSELCKYYNARADGEKINLKNWLKKTRSENIS